MAIMGVNPLRVSIRKDRPQKSDPNNWDLTPIYASLLLDNSLAKAMFTSRKLFSVSLHISAVLASVNGHDPSVTIVVRPLNKTNPQKQTRSPKAP
jgi:hypothetical protein